MTKNTKGTLGLISGLKIEINGTQYDLQMVGKEDLIDYWEYRFEIDHEDTIGIQISVPKNADYIDMEWDL